MVTKKYGSMVNTLENSSFTGGSIDNPTIDLQLERVGGKSSQPIRRESSYLDEDTEVINTPPTVHEATGYQGQKFDLIGFADYMPFGLKQVFAAGASSINQMLQQNTRDEAQQPSEEA